MRKSSVGGTQPLRVRAEDRQSSAAGRLSSGTSKLVARRSGIPMAKKLTATPSLPGHSVIPKSRQSSSMGSNYFGGSRMSNAEMSKKDTRPIHEKSFQQKCASNIIKFLESQRYPLAVNMRMLMTPQTKDFMRIFDFMFKFVDPNYSLLGKMEEEIPRAMKSLCYPYAITKSHLLNIGARHSWPFLLAALDWLRYLIEMTLNYDGEESADTFDDSELSEDKGITDFSIKAYCEFMAGNDEWPELEKEVEERLVGNAVRSAAALVEPHNQLQAELTSLKSRVDKLEQGKIALQKLKEDIVKYSVYKQDVQAHTDQKLKENMAVEAKRNMLREELEAYLEDSRQKKSVCLSQPMNQQEAQELQRLRNSVEEQCNSVQGSINEIQKQIWNEETNISHLREKVVFEEKAYNSKAQTCQFIPASAQNAQGHNFEVNIAFKSNQEELSTVEFLQVKALQQLKESNRTKNLDLVKEEECFEKLNELIKEQADELADSNECVKTTDEDLLYRKEEAYKEANKVQEEIKRLESILRDKRNSGDSDIEQIKESLANLEQQLEKVKVARDLETKCLFQELNDTALVVIEFKQQVDNKALKPMKKSLKEVAQLF